MKYLGYQILALSLCFIFSCQRKLRIGPIKVLDTVIRYQFNNNQLADKFVHFKVSGYQDNATKNREIFNFAQKLAGSENISRYKVYNITFYSSVEEFDKIELKQHPDRLYNMNNTLYTFKWDNGKFDIVKKFKDGRMIDPPNKVIITDLP